MPFAVSKNQLEKVYDLFILKSRRCSVSGVGVCPFFMEKSAGGDTVSFRSVATCNAHLPNGCSKSLSPDTPRDMVLHPTDLGS